MGQLAAYLQRQFQTHCPPGWTAARETPLLSADLRRLLGYAPQVDVLLTHADGRRLWVEFEISRADPVANHAKFATAHLFEPQPERDIFLSMITSHVTAGRRNLAANAIWLMRYAGMEAYQTPLLPHSSPEEIRRLNQSSLADLSRERLDVRGELTRALTISETLAQVETAAIHFVANHMEAALNLHQWNVEMATAAGQALWGRRVVTYFVYDAVTRRFAPSKFCAYVSIPETTALRLPISGATMSLARYAAIDHDEIIFDGQRAHRHLTNNLAMRLVGPAERPDIAAQFDRWRQATAVVVHPAGPKFLVAPDWF